jgi:alpha-galactosidase
MTVTDQLELIVDRSLGVWSLLSMRSALIEAASIQCAWRNGKRRFRSDVLLDAVKIQSSPSAWVAGLKGQRFSLRSVTAENLEFITEMMLLKEQPFCILRIKIENNCENPVFLESVNYCAKPETQTRSFKDKAIALPLFSTSRMDQLRFFGQGWQSWSYAGVLKNDQEFPRSRLGPLSAPMQYSWGKKHPSRPGRFISDFYGALVDLEARKGLLFGFLTQMQAYGQVEIDLNLKAVCALWQDLESVRLPPGATFKTDWACINLLDLDRPEPFDGYLKLVADLHDIKALKKPLSGWCSWYFYGQNISNDILRQHLDWIGQHSALLPLDLFQIDDGYQCNIGDWGRDDHRFPDPLEKISTEIHTKSLAAGIWMAPLAVLPGSDLAVRHPDWLLREGRARVVNAGFGWGRFFNALDGTKPEVRGAIRKWVNRVVSEWGFDYVKLDFLYAGALKGERFDDTKTGAMVVRDILSDIRTTVGKDVFLVGCGCPLGSGIGLIDSMRISPDVSEHWRGRYKGISILVDRDPGYPSAWNAVRNTYYRAHEHGVLWLNDPDCLILRESGSTLNEDEVRTLVSVIALCGGVILDSDDLTGLGDDRIAMFARLLPPINKRPIQPLLFEPEAPSLVLHHFKHHQGNWALGAVFNFSDQSRDAILNCEVLGFGSDHEVIGFEYWDQRVKVFSGKTWNLGVIPEHGVKLWALREASAGPIWVGDTIHISQGLCVSDWKITENTLRALIESDRNGTEKIWLKLPGRVVSASTNGQDILHKQLQQGIISFQIELNIKNQLELEWN